MAVQLYSHVGLTVSDLDRARRFFTEGLGFSVVLQNGEPRGRSVRGVTGEQVGKLLEVDGLECDTLYIERDGQTIELVHYITPPALTLDRRPANATGLSHIAFMVDDMHAEATRLVELGGRALEHTETVIGFGPGDGARIMFVLDPDGGVKVELIQVFSGEAQSEPA